MKKQLMAAAISMALGLGIASSAQAGITVNDWTLNLTGIDGLGATVINGIDQIQFTGVAAATATVQDGNLDVGDTTRVQGLLAATSFLNDGVVILGTNLNNTYEMTFTFDVGGIIIAEDPVTGAVTTTHLAGAAAGATGVLNIYIDAFANGGVQASQSTGLGYTDGVLIASFLVDAGLGGVFTPVTFNGSDDAQFHWLSSLPGVILSSPGGTDLGNSALLAVTASQFDADTNNDGTPDVTCPTSGVIGGPASPVPFNPTNFCAQEDGRASLQTIPEPGSLALLGIALAGLGLSRRRKHTSSK